MTIKLRYGDFTTLTRSTTLGEATNVTDDLRAAAVKLLTAWASRAHRPLRLLGVTASQLTAAGISGKRSRSAGFARNPTVATQCERRTFCTEAPP